jgi:hypothetical protein
MAHTHKFTAYRGRDFENNVRYVEDRKDSVVVIALELEVFLETSEACIT